jgi:ribonucleoside-diphosphate reductase beta chain
MSLEDEILFRSNPTRKAILPIVYPTMWKRYKDLEGSRWAFEELYMGTDINQVHNGDIKPEIMRVVKLVLAFFSGADAIVNENLALNYYAKIQIPEAQFFFGEQISNEQVHTETYNQLVEALFPDKVEQTEILSAIQSMPCVTKLYSWAQKWIKRDHKDELVNANGSEDLAYIWNEAKRFVAFACVEGILFSAAFAIIFWIKGQAILPAFTYSNELISRDEGMHRDFVAYELYPRIVNKPPQNQIIAIIEEAVDFECEFVDEMLPQRLNGMNAELMKKYVKSIADNLAEALGYESIYHERNPFPFMDKISVHGQTNFFEKKVGEYSQPGFEQGADEEIRLDDEWDA